MVEHLPKRGPKGNLRKPHSRSSSNSSITTARLGFNNLGFTHKDSPLQQEAGKRKQHNKASHWDLHAERPPKTETNTAGVDDADDDEWVSSESAVVSPAPEPQDPVDEPRKKDTEPSPHTQVPLINTPPIRPRAALVESQAQSKSTNQPPPPNRQVSQVYVGEKLTRQPPTEQPQHGEQSDQRYDAMPLDHLHNPMSQQQSIGPKPALEQPSNVGQLREFPWPVQTATSHPSSANDNEIRYNPASHFRPRASTPPTHSNLHAVDRQSSLFTSRPHSVHSKRASLASQCAINPLARLPSFKAPSAPTAYLNPTSAQAHMTPLSPSLTDHPPTASPPSSPGEFALKLKRTTSISSIHSAATLPPMPVSSETAGSRRERTLSTFSLNPHLHTNHIASPALSSLSAIPSATSRAPPTPPLMTYFPPLAVTAEGDGIHDLLPKPYLETHLTVTAFYSPGLESLQRVAMSKAQVKLDEV